MLDNFFRINMPYGIARNENHEWMAFNREYMPLGYNDESLKGDPGQSFLDLPIYTKFNRLTEKILLELATTLQRNDKDEIIKVFFYNDATNPVNQTDKNALWENYFHKLKILSKLKRS